MSRIFVTGDTHGGAVGDLDKLTSDSFKEGKTLTKDDYVIICGDFGLIWDVKKSSKREQYYLDWLDEKPWTTLFLDGNHENHKRLDALPTEIKFNNPVGKVNNSIYHLRRGYIYTINKQYFFVFGGGFSIDKARRTTDISWWEREMPNQEEYQRGFDQLAFHDNKVDYILTHSCSNKMFKELSYHQNMDHKISGEDDLRNYFDTVEETVKYKRWYYGHFHYDYLFDKSQILYNLVVELI